MVLYDMIRYYMIYDMIF